MKTFTAHISYAVFNEVEPGVCDAVRNRDRGTPDPTDPVYLKIHEADLAKQWDSKGLRVELDEDDLRELISRFEYYVDCWKDSYRDEPKCYLGLLSSGRAIIAQAKKGLAALAEAA